MVDYWSIYNRHGYISYHPKELDAKPTAENGAYPPTQNA